MKKYIFWPSCTTVKRKAGLVLKKLWRLQSSASIVKYCRTEAWNQLSHSIRAVHKRWLWIFKFLIAFSKWKFQQYYLSTLPKREGNADCCLETTFAQTHGYGKFKFVQRNTRSPLIWENDNIGGGFMHLSRRLVINVSVVAVHGVGVCTWQAVEMTSS